MITRRIFGHGLTALLGTVALPSLCYSKETTEAILDCVWIGFGPLLAGKLAPGLPLQIENRGRRSCILFDGRFLGSLPNGIACSSGSVVLARAAFDEEMRYQISVFI